MNRRNFLNQIGLLTPVVLGYGLMANAQSKSEPVQCPPPPPGPAIKSQIANNHGHVLHVSYEEVIQGVPKTFNIKGQSSHPHQVVLGEEEFAILRIQGQVQIQTSEDAGHSHSVRVIRDPIKEEL